MAVGKLAGDTLAASGNWATFSNRCDLRIELGKPALVDLEHLADLGVDRRTSARVPSRSLSTTRPEIQVGPSPGIGAVGRAKPWSSRK